jgi:hypothetical protein
MARAFVKKNMGRNFVVALVGHNHGLGEAEYIVRLPARAVSGTDAGQRRAVLARALELNNEFAASLRSALADQAAASSTDQL